MQSFSVWLGVRLELWLGFHQHQPHPPYFIHWNIRISADFFVKPENLCYWCFAEGLEQGRWRLIVTASFSMRHRLL